MFVFSNIFFVDTYTYLYWASNLSFFPNPLLEYWSRPFFDRHSLMGNAGEYLSINPSTGEIHVSVDDAFDYHRQNELFVQVSNTYDSWLAKGKKTFMDRLHSELQFSYF